jgi:hypothetical protein
VRPAPLASPSPSTEASPSARLGAVADCSRDDETAVDAETKLERRRRSFRSSAHHLLHRFVQLRECPRHQRAELFGIEMLGEGRKADEICKEYGHYPTLACAGRCKGRTRVDDDCIQLRSAGGAKACVRRQRGAAGGQLRSSGDPQLAQKRAASGFS